MAQRRWINSTHHSAFIIQNSLKRSACGANSFRKPLFVKKNAFFADSYGTAYGKDCNRRMAVRNLNKQKSCGTANGTSWNWEKLLISSWGHSRPIIWRIICKKVDSWHLNGSLTINHRMYHEPTKEYYVSYCADCKFRLPCTDIWLLWCNKRNVNTIRLF